MVSRRASRGSGSITRTAEGTYRLRVTRNGERLTLGTFSTLQAAREAQAAYHELYRGSTEATLREYGHKWLARRVGQIRDTRNEESRFRIHVEPSTLADMPLRSIQRHHVRDFIHGIARAHARQTTAHVLKLVRGILGDAFERGKVRDNAAIGVKVPKPTHPEPERWTWLKVDEIKRGCALPSPLGAAFTFAVYTGLRQGEQFALRWEDVRDNHVLVCRSWSGPPKNSQHRRVPLLPQARTALASLPRQGPCVFGKHSKGYDAGWRRRKAWELVASDGRRVRWHDLRHTCASHLVQGTWTKAPLTLPQVAQWLGHGSPHMTARYAHLCPDSLLSLIADG